jgi:macrodomain Ter protein organizer (MatP/YcbG family)
MERLTTIQLRTQVKNQLDKLKTRPRETYEDTIKRLIEELEIKKRKDKQLLIEGCKEMAKESLKICEEFKFADAEVAEKYGN